MDVVGKIRELALEIETETKGKSILNPTQDLLTEFNDPKFSIWSGCSHEGGHHYGKGGLAKHTLEVIESCLQMHDYYNTKVPKGKIFLAALYHDVGKLWDYQPVQEWDGPYPRDIKYDKWEPTWHKDHIHHLPRSAIEFAKIVVHYDSLREWEDDILHAILSHHGQREWRSPVQPQTPLAHILHLCDSISARVYETRGL